MSSREFAGEVGCGRDRGSGSRQLDGLRGDGRAEPLGDVPPQLIERRGGLVRVEGPELHGAGQLQLEAGARGVLVEVLVAAADAADPFGERGVPPDRPAKEGNRSIGESSHAVSLPEAGPVDKPFSEKELRAGGWVKPHSGGKESARFGESLGTFRGRFAIERLRWRMAESSRGTLTVVATIVFFVFSVCAVACAGAWVIHREAIWQTTEDGRLVPTFPERGPPVDEPPPRPQGEPIDWEQWREETGGLAPRTSPK